MTTDMQRLFDLTYAQTARAAELLEACSGCALGPAPRAYTPAQSKETVRLLTDALCAARELDNRLAGNPPARRGD